MAKVSYFTATGKRKTSVARAYLKPGKGEFIVNEQAFAEYFPNIELKTIAALPLTKTNLQDQMDVMINVIGGGFMGQVYAIRHAIARALLEYNPELRAVLKKAQLLTRDARKKERKKYGQKGARARFQYSKR